MNRPATFFITLNVDCDDEGDTIVAMAQIENDLSDIINQNMGRRDWDVDSVTFCCMEDE